MRAVLPRYQDRRAHIVCGNFVERWSTTMPGGIVMGRPELVGPWLFGHVGLPETDLQRIGDRTYAKAEFYCPVCDVDLTFSMTRKSTLDLPPEAYWEASDEVDESTDADPRELGF